MIYITIEETKEEQDLYLTESLELTFLDEPKLSYNEETERWTCPQEIFDFWEKTALTYNIIEQDLQELKDNGIWEDDHLNYLINDCYNNDFENTTAELLNLIETLKQERNIVYKDIERAKKISEKDNGLPWTDFNYHCETLYEIDDKYILKTEGGALDINGTIIKYINKD